MRPSLTSPCREVVPTAVFDGSELFLRALPRFPLKPASHPGSRTFLAFDLANQSRASTPPEVPDPKEMDQARDLTIRRSQRAFRRRQQKKDPGRCFSSWGENACVLWRDCSGSEPRASPKSMEETVFLNRGVIGILLLRFSLYQVQKGFRGKRLGEKRNAKTSCSAPQRRVGKCRDQDYFCAGRLFF